MKLSLKTIFSAALVTGALLIAISPHSLRAQSVSTNVDATKVGASQADPVLAQQVADLQAKAARLQGALAQNTSPAAKNMPMGQAPAATPMPGMSAAGMGGMGIDKMEKGKMGGMPDKSAAAGSDMGGMMSMMGMMKDMKMGAMPAASPGMAGMPKSALPGFPGVSHLYHIGATGFFLDHAEHINLSTDQQAALSKMKQQALAAKSSSDQQIEQAEQELADLTSADQPDIAKIEKKVSDIEKLRADERLAFIRAVGEGAKLLTDDQRKALTGATPLAAPLASPSASMSPMEHM